MRTEPIEIYSDATNAAIMRHPDRRFPGVLVQGDTLYSMCHLADEACRSVERNAKGYEELNALRNSLWAFMTSYKTTLLEHNIPMPFSEQ